MPFKGEKKASFFNTADGAARLKLKGDTKQTQA